MKHLRALLTVALCCFFIPADAIAGFEEGLAAFKRDDYAKAISEWKPLAEQGDARAQLNLGLMYAEGQGVVQDYKKAVRFYRLAADQGHASAQYNLGVMYYSGLGVAQDYKAAFRLYRLAADQGDAAAQGDLGVLYARGQGVAKDYRQAVRFYRLAANQGEAVAQYNLGVMYDEGQGVAKSVVIAYALFKISGADENFAGAGRSPPTKAISLNPQELKAAENLSREMAKPGNFLKALDAYQTKITP